MKITSIETSFKIREAIGIPEGATHYKSGRMSGFIGTSTKYFWAGKQIKEKDKEEVSDEPIILNMDETKNIFGLEVPDEMKNDLIIFKIAKGLVMYSDIEFPAYTEDEMPNKNFDFPINYIELKTIPE